VRLDLPLCMLFIFMKKTSCMARWAERFITKSAATKQSQPSMGRPGDRHVASLLAMTFSTRAGRPPPAGAELKKAPVI
jgi:hypothetical protein